MILLFHLLRNGLKACSYRGAHMQNGLKPAPKQALSLFNLDEPSELESFLCNSLLYCIVIYCEFRNFLLAFNSVNILSWSSEKQST